ncbi:MAG TPA: hypothetical protein VKE74_14890 [Gemmataceae bacterium]|nr:hypothetical protein [Gemmataceae bacterium]
MTACEPITEDAPIVLFARLEQAVERGDHAAAAEYQQQLARLGIEVRYGRPVTDRKGGRRGR